MSSAVARPKARSRSRSRGRTRALSDEAVYPPACKTEL